MKRINLLYLLSFFLLWGCKNSSSDINPKNPKLSGKLKKISYNSSYFNINSIEYIYDNEGVLLKEIKTLEFKDKSSKTVTQTEYIRNSNGRVIQALVTTQYNYNDGLEFKNNSVIDYIYDSQNNLININGTNVDIPTSKLSIFKYAYVYFPDGNLKEGYDYDPTALTKVQRDIFTYQWQDKNIIKSYHENSKDTAPTKTYLYDDKINPIARLYLQELKVLPPDLPEIISLSKNNIISAKTLYTFELKYEYEYNGQGLPTKVTEYARNNKDDEKTPWVTYGANTVYEYY